MDYSLITKLTESKGLNIKDLANKMSPPVAYSGLYRSIKEETIKVETLEKIAEALEVPVTAFFKDEEIIDNQEEIKRLTENYEKLKYLANNLFQQTKIKNALIMLVQDRIKTSMSMYKNITNNLSEKPDKASIIHLLTELDKIFLSTHDEILSSLTISQLFQSTKLDKDSLEKSVESFEKTFSENPNSDPDLTDKSISSINKFIAYLDNSEKFLDDN